ncbi:MAG: GNAT family N-acetyltransferase [Oscillospiraceae bacterium]|nr:GNAT family N-acetyltransferase [Oscillospiraceae bacterium]
MQNYEIIKLKPADFQKCSNIWNMENRPSLTMSRYNQLVSGSRASYVYTVNGEFLGEGAIVFENDDPDYTITGRRVNLSFLVVKEGYRNQGIGGILVDYILNKAEEMGYKEISIGVDKKNAAALHLYRKKGFTEVIFDGEDEDGPYYKLLKRLGSVTIRLAAPADAPDMAEAHMRSWEVAYKDIIPESYISEKVATRPALYKQIITDENKTNYVIQKGGKTAGVMSIAPDQDDDAGENFYRLQSLYLHPDYYRQGIGTRAVNFAFDKARSLGKTAMTVWVLEENINSIKFYEKCGFIADGKTKILECGKSLIAIRMRRDL